MTKRTAAGRGVGLRGALLLVLALLAAGCGGEDDTPIAAESPDESPGLETPTPDEAEPDPPVDPIELSVAVHWGPDVSFTLAWEWWANEVEDRTNGAVTFDFFHAGSLLPLGEVLDGVRDGRVDIGATAPAFHPAEFPLSNVISLPFITSNAEAQMEALAEVYESNEAFQAEYEALGLHMLGYTMATPSTVSAAQEINDLSDLRGLRIRGFGFLNDALDAVGAQGVAMDAGEIYESMQRGLLDGHTLPLDQIIAFSLQEVTTHVVDSGLGNFGGNQMVISIERWNELPQDVREVMMEVAEEIPAVTTESLREKDDEACDILEELGVSVTVLPEESKQEWRDILGDSLVDRWKSDAQGAGADEVDAFFDEYVAAIERAETDSTYGAPAAACAERLAG